jgi:hypothetical protein
MPRLLKGLLGAELTLGVVLAALLPFLDEDGWGLFSSAVALVPVALCWAFLRRAPFSYGALLGYCAVAALLGWCFVLIQLLTIDSVLMTPTNLLMIVEAALTSVLFFVLKSPSSRSWFLH